MDKSLAFIIHVHLTPPFPKPRFPFLMIKMPYYNVANNKNWIFFRFETVNVHISFFLPTNIHFRLGVKCRHKNTWKVSTVALTWSIHIIQFVLEWRYSIIGWWPEVYLFSESCLIVHRILLSRSQQRLTKLMSECVENSLETKSGWLWAEIPDERHTLISLYSLVTATERLRREKRWVGTKNDEWNVIADDLLSLALRIMNV